MIRAVMISETTGIVENVIMANEQDFANRPNVIIRIPTIQSNDGSFIAYLKVCRDLDKWDGSKFLNSQNEEILFDTEDLERIEELNKLLETEQLPPEVI